MIVNLATPHINKRGELKRESAIITSTTFSDTGSGLVTQDLMEMAIGNGVGASQANGNLLITTGTTANAEYLCRSKVSWKGSMLAKMRFTASQRIADNNFAVLLADLIGENLACVIDSSTQISVTIPKHGYDAKNVGQAMLIGGINGAAGVPGRYVIASVPDENTVRFTVAGWPSSGTCTVDVFGHSYIRNLYNGIVATNSFFDTQRKGWANGDTTATTLTSASPGHIAQFHADGKQVFYADYLAASSTTPNATLRSSKLENVPDECLDLYLFIWSYNGTTAPASTTTWTVGFWSVEEYANSRTYIQGMAMLGSQPPLPVTFSTTQTVNLGTYATPTPITVNSAASTNALSAKTSAGMLYGLTCSNIGAAVAFVKFYNKASSPTVGTDTPVITIPVPAGSVISLNFGALGRRFATGIALAITNLAADSDTTAVAAGQVKVMGDYV